MKSGKYTWEKDEIAFSKHTNIFIVWKLIIIKKKLAIIVLKQMVTNGNGYY